MESPDYRALIRRSKELRGRSAQVREAAAELIAASKLLEARTALLLDVMARVHAYALGTASAEVRRARIPAWPSPSGPAERDAHQQRADRGA